MTFSSSAIPGSRTPRQDSLFRDLRDMTSLLISAVAGAFVTGTAAALILFSAPAYADPAAPDAPTPRTVVPGPETLGPVCTCTLPPLTTD